jgi:CRISPR-associated protein Cst2
LRALLESILHTFLEPAGAMRNTQNPHLVNISGAITLSHDIAPAPCLSPLKPEFCEELSRVSAALNSLRPGAIEMLPFSSTGEFAELMAEIIHNAQPFNLVPFYRG